MNAAQIAALVTELDALNADAPERPMRRLTLAEALDPATRGTDPAGTHELADRVLLTAAPREVFLAYKRCQRRTGQWWFA